MRAPLSIRVWKWFWTRRCNWLWKQVPIDNSIIFLHAARFWELSQMNKESHVSKTLFWQSRSMGLKNLFWSRYTKIIQLICLYIMFFYFLIVNKDGIRDLDCILIPKTEYGTKYVSKLFINIGFICDKAISLFYIIHGGFSSSIWWMHRQVVIWTSWSGSNKISKKSEQICIMDSRIVFNKMKSQMWKH